MTELNETVDTYKAGNKEEAYNLFKNDETAIKNVSFESFCTEMDNIIRRREENSKSMTAHSQAMGV